MRVILIQDVENLGKKYEVKEVKDGYARNFLIPRKLAKIATSEILEWASIQRETQKKRAEESLKEVQETASKMDGLEVSIVVKVGDKDQLFEKITEQKIADKIKEMGFNVKKDQIIIENPIEEIGEFPLKVKFDHNLESEIMVIITEEK